MRACDDRKLKIERQRRSDVRDSVAYRYHLVVKGPRGDVKLCDSPCSQRVMADPNRRDKVMGVIPSRSRGPDGAVVFTCVLISSSVYLQTPRLFG